MYGAEKIGMKNFSFNLNLTEFRNLEVQIKHCEMEKRNWFFSTRGRFPWWSGFESCFMPSVIMWMELARPFDPFLVAVVEVISPLAPFVSLSWEPPGVWLLEEERRLPIGEIAQWLVWWQFYNFIVRQVKFKRFLHLLSPQKGFFNIL